MQTRILLFFLLAGLTVQAQDFSAGFRAGLNFSTLNGPTETAADGSSLEDYSLSSGFHVGGMVSVKFNDAFALRGELLYSQKGVDYDYAGSSFWVFETTQNNQQVFANGDRSTILSITNSYIEVPVLAVGRFGRVEVSGGASVGFLVSSRASGELTFSGATRAGSTVDPFTIALDFNYLQGRTDAQDVEIRNIGGKQVEIPKTLNAYYEFLDEDENLFNTLDFSLVGGVAFFLNQGLFLGVRANYGLVDVTKTERDFSRMSLDEDDNYIPQEDVDRNLVLQASVGFAF